MDNSLTYITVNYFFLCVYVCYCLHTMRLLNMKRHNVQPKTTYQDIQLALMRAKKLERIASFIVNSALYAVAYMYIQLFFSI